MAKGPPVPSLRDTLQGALLPVEESPEPAKVIMGDVNPSQVHSDVTAAA
jgi:hypothetical protein